MAKPSIKTWKTTRKVVGSKAYAQSTKVTFELPKTGIVKKFILRFAGTIAGSAWSVTAQPRPTARALGFLTFNGKRPGHVGFNMKRVPAHMLQLRERILQGVSAVETAIAGAAGAFSLQLSISMADTRIKDRGEQATSGLDLANFSSPELQIDCGQLISTNGDNDNVALIGTATNPAINNATITLTLEMMDLPHAGYLDHSFEYSAPTGTAASAFTDMKLTDSGLRMYDIIETVGMDANGIETALNAIPTDQTSLVRILADNNPIFESYGPDLQEDEMKSLFPSLSTPPTGLYVLDHAKGHIGGLTWAEEFGNAKQRLDVQNGTAGSLSTTTLKCRTLHLTLNG